MKRKCDYCGNYIDSYDEKCSNCGSINYHLAKKSNQTPKTIEELKKWYIDKNLPDENITRFFIGRNYQKPKAFGIYKDEKSQTFIVYKNKSDGSRAIRYQGNDEAYAVNELYLRLKEEIINQKNHSINNSDKINLNKKNNNNNSFNPSKYQQDLENYRKIKREYVQKEKKIISKKPLFFIFFILLLLHILPIISSMFYPHKGYYNYYGNYYYYQYPFWYIYNNYYGWDYTSAPEGLKKHSSDYYESFQYNDEYNISNFENSKFYVKSSSSSSSDSSWDSGSSWDSSSSWDSGSTDWDSDW